MEEEVRIILRKAVTDGPSAPRNLADFTRACFAPLGGVELEPPPARADARTSKILLTHANVRH